MYFRSYHYLYRADAQDLSVLIVTLYLCSLDLEKELCHVPGPEPLIDADLNPAGGTTVGTATQVGLRKSTATTTNHQRASPTEMTDADTRLHPDALQNAAGPAPLRRCASPLVFVLPSSRSHPLSLRLGIS